MEPEVHRASRTYYTHSLTLLNVPNRQLDALLHTPSWHSIAAAKFLDLPETRDRTLASLINHEPPGAPAVGELTSQDLDELLSMPAGTQASEVLAEMHRRREQRRREVEQAQPQPLADQVTEFSGVPPEIWKTAGHELLDTLLPFEGREQRIQPTASSGEPERVAIANVGLERLTLVPDFPILTATYGFSRVDFAPNTARLNAFPPERAQGGRKPVFVDQVGADALVLSLDGRRVVRWLEANGHPPALPPGTDADAARRGYFVQLLTGVTLRETIPVAARTGHVCRCYGCIVN